MKQPAAGVYTKSPDLTHHLCLALACTLCLVCQHTAFSADNWSWRGGLGGGYIIALTVDPTDSQTAYATNQGGLFKTADGGTNWTMVAPFSGTGVVRIDPNDHDTVYAILGTIWRSTDRGKTGSNLSVQLVLDFVSQLVLRYFH